MTQTFKRGQRVRYVANHVPSFKGKAGTVTGKDSKGFLRVRFDFQNSYENGLQCDPSSLQFERESYEQPEPPAPALSPLVRARLALAAAERFIAGFEDDEQQEGIADLLAQIRSAQA